MKRLDADDVYCLINLLFRKKEDEVWPAEEYERRLRLFNLVTEVANGALVYEVLSGSEEVVAAEDALLQIAIGFGGLGLEAQRLEWIMGAEGSSEHETVLQLAGTIEQSLGGITMPPYIQHSERPGTLAALGACRRQDGRCAYALFRHPHVTAEQARVLIAMWIQTEAQLTSEQHSRKAFQA